MNTLDLEKINQHAPYGSFHLRQNNNYSFYFETDFGLKYTISFMFEYLFIQTGAFQFFTGPVVAAKIRIILRIIK